MVDCDAVSRVSNASYHLAVIASSALLDSELSGQSSSMVQRRFFPTPFGRTSNHHSSDPDMLQERTKPLCFTRMLVSSFCAFGLCKSVYDGAVEDRLGFCGLLRFFCSKKKASLLLDDHVLER